MFSLDTNAAITAINERNPQIAARLDAEIARGTPILLSSIVLYELHYGIAKSARPDKNLALLDSFLAAPITIIAFEAGDAIEAGDIRALLTKAGTPIGPYDILIAAQARRRSSALVTLNSREFTRIPGLIVTDWAT